MSDLFSPQHGGDFAAMSFDFEPMATSSNTSNVSDASLPLTLFQLDSDFQHQNADEDALPMSFAMDEEVMPIKNDTLPYNTPYASTSSLSIDTMLPAGERDPFQPMLGIDPFSAKQESSSPAENDMDRVPATSTFSADNPSADISFFPLVDPSFSPLPTPQGDRSASMSSNNSTCEADFATCAESPNPFEHETPKTTLPQRPQLQDLAAAIMSSINKDGEKHKRQQQQQQQKRESPKQTTAAPMLIPPPMPDQTVKGSKRPQQSRRSRPNGPRNTRRSRIASSSVAKKRAKAAPTFTAQLKRAQAQKQQVQQAQVQIQARATPPLRLGTSAEKAKSSAPVPAPINAKPTAPRAQDSSSPYTAQQQLQQPQQCQCDECMRNAKRSSTAASTSQPAYQPMQARSAVNSAQTPSPLSSASTSPVINGTMPTQPLRAPTTNAEKTNPQTQPASSQPSTDLGVPGGSSSGMSRIDAINAFLKSITEEEKVLIEELGVSVPSKGPVTPEHEKELKVMRRKVKNKLSAKDSRRKRKAYIETLEKDNSDLKASLSETQRELQAVKQQLNASKMHTVPTAAQRQQRSSHKPNTYQGRSSVSAHAGKTCMMLVVALALTAPHTPSPSSSAISRATLPSASVPTAVPPALGHGAPMTGNADSHVRLVTVPQSHAMEHQQRQGLLGDSTITLTQKEASSFVAAVKSMGIEEKLAPLGYSLATQLPDFGLSLELKPSPHSIQHQHQHQHQSQGASFGVNSNSLKWSDSVRNANGVSAAQPQPLGNAGNGKRSQSSLPTQTTSQSNANSNASCRTWVPATGNATPPLKRPKVAFNPSHENDAQHIARPFVKIEEDASSLATGARVTSNSPTAATSGFIPCDGKCGVVGCQYLVTSSQVPRKVALPEAPRSLAPAESGESSSRQAKPPLLATNS